MPGAPKSGRIKKAEVHMGLVKTTSNTYTYGHGTCVMRLMMDIAPRVAIYIARIAEEKYLDVRNVQGVVNAIKWELHTVNVDIMAMPFGVRDSHSTNAIKAVIYEALDSQKILFATAANDGARIRLSYPASED
ncbi:hypothetical protein K456DRAFT_40930 [Colletotrichum gloeosporioides 23]|nr:hypothetical protein K456DRAFT_40930 [Colletotrichum gloeosporioides 23]